MKRWFIVILLIIMPYTVYAQTEYIVQTAIQNKIFYVAGQKFKAVGTCDVDKGDIVVFEGNFYDCFQISFYNRNKGSYCTVYCNHR